MDDMNFWVPFWRTTCRVDVMSTKVTTIFKSILDWEIGKVLVTESDNLALSNKQSQLIFAFFCEFAELNTTNFRANGRCEVLNLGTVNQEVLERGICILAMFDMFKGFERRVLLTMVPNRKIMWVLHYA